jgi:hypothetical protein
MRFMWNPIAMAHFQQITQLAGRLLLGLILSLLFLILILIILIIIFLLNIHVRFAA